MFGGISMLGSIQVQAPQIRKSLIPQLPSKIRQNAIIEKVEKVLEKKHINPNADTSDLERQIDKLVYDLYGLTEEEIAVIESA